ncbi:hypothetical protein [Polymorphobacter megasporae]|uniref:hypothetical protein n=1 Tax=Glacieibacterium megasporae TaxID=2835787 RepID=UPI002103C2BE|nr:hypothetical protein [Polymorphobacter megasporae]
MAAAAAAAGHVTCLIDTDPQATAAAWGDWRGKADPEVITTPPLPVSARPSRKLLSLVRRSR